MKFLKLLIVLCFGIGIPALTTGMILYWIWWMLDVGQIYYPFLGFGAILILLGALFAFIEENQKKK